MLKKPGFSHGSKAVASSLALLLGICLATQAQAGPRIEFGEDGGFLQVDLKGQIFVENTSKGGGIKGDDSRTDIHFMRNRIGMTGMLDETWGYKIQTCGNTGTTKMPFLYGLSAQDNDWNDRDIRVIDAYAIANLDPAFNLKVGLTKIPLTRANLDDCFAPLSQDRSMFAYSAYGNSPAKFSRDLGGVAYGRFFDDRLTYFAGIFQGREGSSAVQSPLPTPAGGGTAPGQTFISSNAPKTMLEYVGRITYDFLDSEGGSGYQGTYFGEKNVLNIGFGMAYQPDAAYKYTSNTGAPSPSMNAFGSVITPGKPKDTVDYTAYALDLMFEHELPVGVVTVTGQYLKTDFEDAWKTNSTGDRLSISAGMNGQKEGGYGKMAYILPFTIGKAGKIQPYALYEYWEFAHLMGKNEQILNQYGGGINYYVSGDNRIRLTGEYLKTDFNQAINYPVAGVIGTSPTTSGYTANIKSFDTFRMMLQVVF